jgi:hypothetical protein
MQVIISSDKDELARIEIINNLGQQVLAKSYNIFKGETTITLDVSALATSFYAFRVITDEGEHDQKEFIKK